MKLKCVNSVPLASPSKSHPGPLSHSNILITTLSHAASGANVSHLTFKQLHMICNLATHSDMFLVIISHLMLKYQNCSVSVQKCPKIK